MFWAASSGEVLVKVPCSKTQTPVLYETKPNQQKAVKSLLKQLGWQELIGAIPVWEMEGLSWIAWISVHQ